MNMDAVLKEYDAMFGVKTPEEILDYLEQNLVEAQQEKDTDAQIVLLNEIIGFCRDASMVEEGIGYAGILEDAIEENLSKDRREYATTMLNLGNAYRGYGKHDLSAERYDVCEECFGKLLAPEDFLYAGLFNNRGLLYQELGDWEKAIAEFRRALAIAKIHKEKEIERATTCANLATAMLNASPEYREEAKLLLEEAGEIFEKDGGKDFHYSAALSALGTVKYEEGDYAGAAEDFKRAMEILYAGTGESEAYLRVRSNYETALRRARQNGTYPEESLFGEGDATEACEVFFDDDEELKAAEVAENEEEAEAEAEEEPLPQSSEGIARRFYKKALLPRLQEELPEALELIAIGYAGEGSEHFGYDDEISTDHDFARGCMIWLQELHAPVYGAKLQEIYCRAYTEYFGEAPELRMGRQGVRLIDDYFEHLTGLGGITMLFATGGLDGQLYYLSEDQLNGIAAAVNGSLWLDEDGTMLKLRQFFLERMPEEYRRRKLATLTHLYSQAGQYDYARSMRRGDHVTAQLYKARAMETAMQIVSYLNHRFPPYLKWLRRFVSELDVLPEISDLCAALADMKSEPERFADGGADDIALTFDIIATLLLEEMKSQALIKEYTKEDPFMDRYIGEIAGISAPQGVRPPVVLGTVSEQAKPGLMQEKEADGAVKTAEFAAFSAEEEKKPEDADSAVGITAYSGSEENSSSETENEDAQTEEQMMSREELIEAIIKEEWEQFDKTINEGGRADCQDNWETFSVMRRSQYLTWDDELLVSFYYDLTRARAQGRNLITEKYGRMMESTAPQRYAELAPYFPAHNAERLQIQEEIVRIQVGWMEDFAEKYPCLAGNARSIHTFEDTEYNTSYETYLRGEIGTYSDTTLLLYGRFIAELAQAGKNLAYETMNNTAKLLGYKDADDAEQKMSAAE